MYNVQNHTPENAPRRLLGRWKSAQSVSSRGCWRARSSKNIFWDTIPMIWGKNLQRPCPRKNVLTLTTSSQTPETGRIVIMQCWGILGSLTGRWSNTTCAGQRRLREIPSWKKLGTLNLKRSKWRSAWFWAWRSKTFKRNLLLHYNNCNLCDSFKFERANKTVILHGQVSQ